MNENEIVDLGHFGLGKAPTIAFVFKQSRLAKDPGVAPVLNVTVGGVQSRKTLIHAGDGTYTWTPYFTVAGFYTATAYAPEGSGEDAQRFVFIVDKDENYP